MMSALCLLGERISHLGQSWSSKQQQAGTRAGFWSEQTVACMVQLRVSCVLFCFFNLMPKMLSLVTTALDDSLIMESSSENSPVTRNGI